MGCGAFGSAHSPSTTNHTTRAMNILSSLLPLVAICSPFLGERALRSFQDAVKGGQGMVLTAPKCTLGADPSGVILQKWKILLYGMHKYDEIYRRCLSFEVRQDRERQTEGQIAPNQSYHQLKAVNTYHECFNQIEKDLTRTFDFQAEKRLKFEQILKRISNYFPSMGYTQGVNFVVGYLLLLSYSQSDTFWLFVHLAQSRRYLVLGLYEEGFPLAYLYTTMFRNMLKRMDPKLHSHLYATLMLDQATWIFKWFITYFVYSFPQSTLQYLWNAVIEIGGIAVVYYALAITLTLKPHLITLQDPCDFVLFWKNLKEPEIFNEMVKMNQIMDKVYQMRMVRSDLDGTKESPHSFYRSYFLSLQEQATNDDMLNKMLTQGPSQDSNSTKVLHNWYAKLTEERMQFQQQPEESLRSFSRRELVPQQLRSQYNQMAKSIRDLEEQVFRNESLQEIEKSSRHVKPDEFFEDIPEEGLSPQRKAEEIQEGQGTEPYLQTTIMKQVSYDIAAEIDEEQNQSRSSLSETKGEEEPPVKVNTYLGINFSKRSLKGQQMEKAGRIPLQGEDKRTGLSIAGQNILCNISVSNSHYSSESSKHSSSFKPKKQKENTMQRFQGNGKVKTEQSSLPSSEQQESLATLQDHHNISGYSHRGPIRGDNRIDVGRVGQILGNRKTQPDLMSNSHGPEQKKIQNAAPEKDLGSQIEIFNGQNLFKKKKKHDRTSNLSIDGNQPQTLRISGMQKLNFAFKSELEEESLDSGVGATSRNRGIQIQNVQESMYEIESMK